MADDDTKDPPRPRSWTRFDARLAALAAISSGDRKASTDDSTQPFDGSVVAGLAAADQTERAAPLDNVQTSFDARIAAILAEANSSGEAVPATAATSVGVIEAERTTASSTGVDVDVPSVRSVSLEDMNSAESAEKLAQRLEAGVAGENEVAQPPAPQPELPRTVDVPREPDQALRLLEPDPALCRDTEPDGAVRIDYERDAPAAPAPSLTRRADTRPSGRVDVETELTSPVEEAKEKRIPTSPIDVETAATAALLGAVLVIGFATVRNYGITAEELTYDAFGAKALVGYRSAFADLASPIYAPWFQALTAFAQSFGFASGFDVRHAATFVIGLAGLAALLPIGRLTLGRWAGLIAITLCLMTGALYGRLFFSPNDVPFMAAMTWATLAVIVMVQREVPAWWATIGAGLLIGLTIATRPDGTIMYFYLIAAVMLCALEILLRGGAHSGGRLIRLGARLIVALALAGIVAVALLPWLQEPDALSRLKAFFSQFRAPPADQTVHSWGKELSSERLPWFYAPGELLARLPEGFLILLGVAVLAASAATLMFVAGCLGKIGERGLRGLRTAGLLLAFLLARSRGTIVVVVAALVPLVIVMIMRPPIGEGIRHLLYVIPPLGLIAAWGLLNLTPLIRGFPISAAVVAGIAIAWTVLALIVLHPLEYVATNALAGGTRGSHGRFELDHAGAAATEALRRLEQRLAYDTSGRYALRTPSIHICMPGDEQLITPMFKRAWNIEPDPQKADFIIETERMRCGKDSEGVVVDEVKRFDVPFAWTIETAARIPNQDQVPD